MYASAKLGSSAIARSSGAPAPIHAENAIQPFAISSRSGFGAGGNRQAVSILKHRALSGFGDEKITQAAARWWKTANQERPPYDQLHRRKG